MSYEKLPIELRMFILTKLHNIYETNARVIQTYWYKFSNPQKVAMKLWKDFEENDHDAWGEDYYNDQPNLIIPKTAKLMKYSSKVLTGKGNFKKIQFWKKIIYFIDDSLCLEQYTGGPQAYLYNEIEEYFNIMSKKFNIILNEDGRLCKSKFLY